MQFKDLDLVPEVLDGLRDVGFDNATPIQEQCIPIILKGSDLLASAQTGTGKTAAFAIPVLNQIFKEKKEGIRALVLTPTRELAKQVDEQFWSIGYHTGITTATVYGGDDWSRQSKALHKGVDVIVATPGRLLDQMKVKSIDFSSIDFFILDEADRMLDMGFIPDVMKIMRALPEKRQNLMFSATMPPKIVQLVQQMMKNPEQVALATNKPAKGITQVVYNVNESDKLPLVLALYEESNWTSAIIFTSTKRNADVLARELQRKGASVTSIHGDKAQEDREKALESFRKGEFRVIVATDVISRGIDIDNISHVINYSVPRDVEDYVHRIGRTARAESKGDAITFVSGADRRFMAAIYKELGDNITKLELPDSVKASSPEGSSDSNEDRKDDRRRSGKGRSSQSSQKPGKRKPKVDAGDKKKSELETVAPEEQSDKKPFRKPNNKRRESRKKTTEARGDDQNQNAKRDFATEDKSSATKKRPPRFPKKQKRSKPEDAKPIYAKKQDKRVDLIEKVQSPNMARIEKKLEQNQAPPKTGVWGFVKRIFSSNE